MTTETTTSIGHAARDLYGTARNIITAELANDGNPLEAAKLLRQQIRAAWARALEDGGVPENEARRLRFPI